MKRFVFAGALLVAGYATAVIADAPKVAVQKIFSSTTTATGQTLDVPKHPELDVFVATFPSGARLPEHKHPFPTMPMCWRARSRWSTRRPARAST